MLPLLHPTRMISDDEPIIDSYGLVLSLKEPPKQDQSTPDQSTLQEKPTLSKLSQDELNLLFSKVKAIEG
jgi:hypothetical protein